MTANFIPHTEKSKGKDQDLPKCVYQTGDFECEILKVSTCIGKTCSFFQTQEEHQESKRLWIKKMNTLSEERQKDIAYTYFNGKMPWRL